jgi:hypothetical protein
MKVFFIKLVDKAALIDLFHHCNIDKVLRLCTFGRGIPFGSPLEIVDDGCYMQEADRVQ